MKNHITLKQKIVEILAYVLMWASIVIGIIWSAKLPKEVATHFDAAGNADGYGSPYSFLFLPIIMLISCGISSLVLHFMPPDLWSMPVKVKPEHAVRVYRDVVWMMVGMEFCFGVFTLYSHDNRLYAEDGWHACSNVYIPGSFIWNYYMVYCRVCAA